jgi:hypothetical protein
VPIARGIVGGCAAAVAQPVAAAVADTDVQVTVPTDVDVTAVVIAPRRRDPIDQDEFGCGADRVRTREREARHAVHACAAAIDSVEEVDVTGGGERGIDRDAKEPPLARGANYGRQIERGCGDECTVGVDAKPAWLGRDQEPAVWREGKPGGARHRCQHDIVKAGRDHRVRVGSIDSQQEHGSEQGALHGCPRRRHGFGTIVVSCFVVPGARFMFGPDNSRIWSSERPSSRV